MKNNEISIETITERLQEVTQLSEELDQALQSAQQDCIVFSIHPLEKEVNNNCVDLEEKSDRCFGVMDRNLSEVCSQLKTRFYKNYKICLFISRKRTKQTINCALMKSFSLPRTRLCNTPGRLRTTQPQSANSTLPHGGNMDVMTSKIM